MAQFSVPAAPSRSILVIDEFHGVDFTNSPTNVDEKKSPNAPNMIRDVPGKVRKSMGWHTVKQYSECINGVHFRRDDTDGLVHSGTKLYKGDDEVYSEANDERSQSWQFGENLYIVDGKALLTYDGTDVKLTSTAAKIPTLTIAKSPTGGGTPFEDLNLIQPAFIELFAGTETDKVYSMTFSGLDAVVLVEKLQSNGTWKTLSAGTDYTADLAAGKVTFTTAPGKSPITGEDNVRITASRLVAGYADRINKCRFGTLFGVNGAADRLFLSGNPDFVNYDWHSGQNDPTYWPDTGYSVIGTEKSAIVGYSIINDRLATHKDDQADGRNVVIRQGDLVDSEAVFPVVNTLQGRGAVATYSFAYLVNEPLFLTKLGVYAITAQDITGEKYAQNRSFFVNGKLLEEENLQEAFAFVYKDLYWLCINGVAYILDGLQPLQTDKSMPYSTRQYAAFYRTNVPARVMWEREGQLFFGSPDGRICQFYDDPASQLSYNDDGQPIYCCWETPDFSGKLFYKNKTFRFLAVRLAAAIATSVKLYGRRRGIWTFIKEDDTRARYFNWQYLDWSKFSWSNDETPQVITTKVRIKKVDKSRFRLENDVLNEPFGINDVAIEYVENGNFKG
jgi:hypothetical protein